MQRFTVILFIFQLFVFRASAFQQTVQPVKNFSQEDGLPSSTIHVIEQDSSGYMWFGTDVGLTRYDGYRFKNYAVSEGLPGVGVTDLQCDNQGRLWIMTEGRLCYLFKEKFYYHDKPLPQQEENAEITSFLVAKNGRIWFTTKEKLIALDSHLNVVWISDKATDVPFDHPEIQCEDDNGALWVHDGDKYMLKILGEEVAIVALGLLPKQRFSRAACIDNDIFYTNGHDLIKLSQRKNSLGKTPKDDYYLNDFQEEILLSSEQKTIQTALPFLMKDANNRIWTAKSDGEFVILNKPQNNMPKFPEGIIASDMHEDSSGNLWFATQNQGVYFLDASTYSAANSIRLFLSEKSVKNICSSDGHVFIVADDDLYRFYENQDTFYRQNDVDSGINAMAFANDKDLLLGYDNRILRYNNGIQQRYNVEGVSTMIARDSTLYYGTDKQLRKAEFSKLSLADNMLNRSITCIFIDKIGDVWIGTENGLHKNTGDENNIDYKNELDVIFGHNISGIGQTSDGIMWIATKGAGVIGLRGEDFIVINTDDYLSHDYCTGLIVEDDVLWVSTGTSVHKIADINFDEGEYYLSSLSQKDIFQLSDIQSIATSDSHVYVGTQHGLIQVSRQYFAKNYAPSRVLITDIFQADTTLALDGVVQLKHKNNTIRINYAAINYAQRNNIVYQYQMIGVEKGWKKAKDAIPLTYVLPPGDYTFEVQAFGGSWKSPSKPATLDIKVSPPFTQTTIFRLFVAFLTAVLFISLYRVYDDGRQKTRLKEVVAQKTADLKQNVNELERTNHELEEFNYVVAHDLKAPLRSIHSFSQLLKRTDGESLSAAGKDYVGFIQQSAESLQATIEDLLAFSSIDKTDNDENKVDLNEVLTNALDNLQGIIEIQNVQIERNELPVVSANHAHMLQVFQNLISNGIKYQPKDHQPIVQINCVEKGKEWLFAVKDNGIGIDKQYEDKVFRIFQRLHSAGEYSGTGIGLPIVKKIIESNRGKIWFESELGEGTTFFFTLPM